MTEIDLERIKTLAGKFRTALVAVKADLPIQFAEFPHGACGDTSLLLGEYFMRNGLGSWDYITGARGTWTHAWIQSEDLIVDITGDQFEDMRIPAFVQRSSSWHIQFNGKQQGVATIDRFDGDTRIMLRDAYTVILGELDRR